ncbi:MAG: RNA methyltransferase [Nitrospiraceae bacterium]|nr:MAG: RNA methyltransferase [Nitrospiraceae bacterium]
MSDWKENIFFTLVEPREPGNIGASARAIKNMGFHRLCLVNPPSFMTDEARWLARNARDVLESSACYRNVTEAVADTHFVVGTSRRRGRRRGVFLPVEEGVCRIRELAQTRRVALLFGREDRGLYNEEIDECAFLMTIPASGKQPSLNLAQAVIIIAYELSKAGLKAPRATRSSTGDPMLSASPPKMARQEDLGTLYERLEQALCLIDYIPYNNDVLKKIIMQNLKHCLGRAGLTEWEYNMFHGICKAIERKAGKWGIEKVRK